MGSFTFSGPAFRMAKSSVGLAQGFAKICRKQKLCSWQLLCESPSLILGGALTVRCRCVVFSIRKGRRLRPFWACPTDVGDRESPTTSFRFATCASHAQDLNKLRDVGSPEVFPLIVKIGFC